MAQDTNSAVYHTTVRTGRTDAAAITSGLKLAMSTADRAGGILLIHHHQVVIVMFHTDNSSGLQPWA